MNHDDEIAEFNFTRSYEPKLLTFLKTEKEREVIYDKLQELALSLPGVTGFGKQINSDIEIYVRAKVDANPDMFTYHAQQILHSLKSSIRIKYIGRKSNCNYYSLL